MSGNEQADLKPGNNSQIPEKLISSEPRLQYILHLLDLRKPIEKPDGSKESWLELPKEVRPYETAAQMTDNIRMVVEGFVAPNIGKLFFGDSPRIPSFKNFTKETMVTALAQNQPEEVLEGVSGQRREVLLSVAAGVVSRIENYVTRKVLENAGPDDLQKLGLTADLRDLTVDLLKISTRVNPLFTRFLAWGQKSPKPPGSATVTEFFTKDDAQPHAQANLFPKESQSLNQGLQQIAETDASWQNYPGGSQFRDYIQTLANYWGETDSKKASLLRKTMHEQYRKLMETDFPIFVTPPTEGYYKEPYDDPEIRVSIASPDLKPEEEMFSKAKHAYAASLDTLGVSQFKEGIENTVSRSSVTLGMYGVNLLFDAAAQENPAIMLYVNQQKRTYDRKFPEFWRKILGPTNLSVEQLELMSRTMVMLHEFGHPVYPDGSDEAERMGREPVTDIDEVKAENLFRAVLPEILEKGGLEGTREQWADAMLVQTLQNIVGENSESVYFKAAAFSLNNLLGEGIVIFQGGNFQISDYDKYFQITKNNALELLRLYQDPTMNSTKASRFIKERCAPNELVQQAIIAAK